MAGKGETNHSADDVGGAVRSLQETPTWALATVCFVFVAVSIVIERFINLISTRLKKNKKTSLLEAVENLKSVLMVLGFMSLLINVIEVEVSKICIPIKYANRMLPCHETKTSLDDEDHDNFFHHCSKGKTSLISQEGLTQLSVFFFVLACMHIIFSLATLLLGMAKMTKWKSWEKETQTVDHLAANDPNRFRITRETTFARRHLNSWSETSIQLWFKCFFRQFYNSVAKVDYLTLRNGFIHTHLSANNSFNFQQYIQRSLHEDFKTVVGISPLMWLIVVIFMLLDVHGWRVYFWMSFVPLIMVLVIGTKLEVIVARMAINIKDNNSVIRGSPLVEPNDKHFWFYNPRFLLNVLHYTLFLNTFEIAFFVWITWKFGINSCYHDHRVVVVTRLVLAVTVQVLSSYITLPLYAIVTQMGSSYKRGILQEDTANVLRRWHGRVRNVRKGNQMPETKNNGDDNDVDINSRENQIQPEVVYDFRFSGRQPPILQDIQMKPKGDRNDGEEKIVGSETN